MRVLDDFLFVVAWDNDRKQLLGRVAREAQGVLGFSFLLSTMKLAISALVPREGRNLFDVDFKRASAFLLGGEGGGLPDDLLAQVDQQVSIPMRQPVESLNVGVAAALVLYEAFRQRQ